MEENDKIAWKEMLASLIIIIIATAWIGVTNYNRGYNKGFNRGADLAIIELSKIIREPVKKPNIILKLTVVTHVDTIQYTLSNKALRVIDKK